MSDAFTCPRCGRVSHNPRDLAERFCGVCGFVDDDLLSLGPCCGCGGDTAGTHNVIMLTVRNKVPGHGWGCVVCHLPPDGAVAVLCGACLDRAARGVEDVLRFACRGYPDTDGRAPIGEFTEPFTHDLSVPH
jgi:hypothetical protein